MKFLLAPPLTLSVIYILGQGSSFTSLCLFLLLDFFLKASAVKFSNKFFHFFSIIFVLIFWILFKININETYIFALGLAFLLFRSISLSLDSFEKKIQISFYDYLTYMLYLPTFFSGPFIAYDHFTEEISKRHRYGYLSFQKNIAEFTHGIVLKLIFSNCFYSILLSKKSNDRLTAIDLLTMLFATVFYITADLTSYTSLARSGSKAIWGVELPINFKRSLFSKNISDFWRRHHITMGSWHGKYIFYPLQIHLLRKKLSFKASATWALVATFLFSGIWHVFGLAGIYFGLINLIAVAWSTKISNRFLKSVILWLTVTLSFQFLLPSTQNLWHKLSQIDLLMLPNIPSLIDFSMFLVLATGFLLFDYVFKSKIKFFMIKYPMIYWFFVGMILSLGFLIKSKNLHFFYSQF